MKQTQRILYWFCTQTQPVINKIFTRVLCTTGTHVKQVEARGTTKECARCGVETAKPIWVREHSCPACGFECSRDGNASLNVLQQGFAELGLGWPESTPVETVLPVDTTVVSAKHVVEAGSLRA